MFADRYESSDLTCYQNTVGEWKISCSWQTKPSFLDYKIVVRDFDGPIILTKDVRGLSTTFELTESAGNTFLITLMDVSVQITLFGTSTRNWLLFRSFKNLNVA